MARGAGRPLKYSTWALPPEVGDAGVFAIKCAATGKVYVGASKNIKQTLTQYRSLLNLDKMPEDMCKDFKAHGFDGFQVVMLEAWIEGSGSLVMRRQEWIKSLRSQGFGLYNIWYSL